MKACFTAITVGIRLIHTLPFYGHQGTHSFLIGRFNTDGWIITEVRELPALIKPKAYKLGTIKRIVEVCVQVDVNEKRKSRIGEGQVVE